MNVDRFEKPLLSGSEGIRAKGRQVDVEHLFYRIQTGRDPSTRKVILRDISFSLSQGSLCALMGPSGSGKR